MAGDRCHIGRTLISELLHVGRRFARREVAMWGIFLGFLAADGTGLRLAWGGA